MMIENTVTFPCPFTARKGWASVTFSEVGGADPESPITGQPQKEMHG